MKIISSRNSRPEINDGMRRYKHYGICYTILPMSPPKRKKYGHGEDDINDTQEAILGRKKKTSKTKTHTGVMVGGPCAMK